MNILNYANPATPTPRPLWPAILIALAGCPAASMTAAILGCQLALGGAWLSAPNLIDSILWGAFAGIPGGIITAGLAGLFRTRSIPIALAGTLIVATLSGIALFLLASMIAAC